LELAVHSTQRPASSQTSGSSTIGQSLATVATVHSTQRPVSALQRGVDSGHSASAVQARQRPLATSQIGEEEGQAKF
jgi:hypothetical protein